VKPVLLTLVAAALGAGGGLAAWRAARAYAPPGGSPPAPAMAAVGAVVFAWAALATPPTWILAASLVLGWTLLALGAIDIACLRLPDLFTLPLVAAGLAVSLALPGAPLLDHLAGAAGGYLALAALAWAFARWRGFEGLGLGDAKLLAAGGAWLGWMTLPSVVLIACAIAFVQVGVAVARRGRAALAERIAFGAPLAAAIWIVWLYGPLTR
jgi:leader peptidase (prepilin peptidase)/N-methyltransferase